MSVRKTVLVVDDQESNRAIVSQILSEEYDTLQAANGKEALAVLREHGTSLAESGFQRYVPILLPD